ncbi:hypothetical protein B0J14DRAFT_184511 [Halenospora varia]|nr:hypothetical protein B0J14DRAFT_184511 [Halenospora varia]
MSPVLLRQYIICGPHTEMAQPSRPSTVQKPDRNPSVALAPASARPAPQEHRHANPSAARIELASNPILEGILGPNKDGRVGNPVPSKLRGETDNMQGNFGVMRMGLSPGGKEASEGDAAAWRTNENTSSQAKATQQEKYMPKKRGLEATLSEAARVTNRGSRFGRNDKRQARPLAPDEAKMEQARLLTLLRSINPVTVVDQICKAVAYFGGIPGAPPPEDGIFPESANTGETGALFIGWLAEIFPDLSSSRSIEGKKNGQAFSVGGDGGTAAEPPNSRNGYGFGPWGLPQNLVEVDLSAPSVPETLQMGASPEVPRQPEPQQSVSTPLQPSQEHLANNASTSKRRRGRPKVCINKKGSKADRQQSNAANGASNMEFEAKAQSQAIEQQMQQEHQSPQMATANNNPIRQYHDHNIHSSEHSWQNNIAKRQVRQAPILSPYKLSPEEWAVLKAIRNRGLLKRKRAPQKPKPRSQLEYENSRAQPRSCQ